MQSAMCCCAKKLRGEKDTDEGAKFSSNKKKRRQDKHERYNTAQLNEFIAKQTLNKEVAFIALRCSNAFFHSGTAHKDAEMRSRDQSELADSCKAHVEWSSFVYDGARRCSERATRIRTFS